MKEKKKYSVDDISKISNSNDRIAKALIFVANELHNIYSVFKKIEK